MEKRDEFSRSVKEALAKRVGYCCSNPNCQKSTTGPRADSTKSVNIGVAAHITAALKGGPRFDFSLSTEERSSSNNGIWLCQNCAKLIDNDTIRFSAEKIKSWKIRAEKAARERVEGAQPTTVGLANAEISSEWKIINERSDGRKHEYSLEFSVKNLSSRVLSNYHLDVEFPSCVLLNPPQELKTGAMTKLAFSDRLGVLMTKTFSPKTRRF